MASRRADDGDVGGATADVDVDAPEFVHILGRAAAGERVGLGDGRHQLQVQLLGDGLEGPDVGERGEGVKDGYLQDLALKVEGVGHRVAVDVHRGDAAVDQLDVDLGHAQLVGHLAHRLLESAALDGLERRGDVGLGDPGLGLGAGGWRMRSRPAAKEQAPSAAKPANNERL